MDRAKAKSITRTVQTVAVGLLGLTAVAAIVPLGAKAAAADAQAQAPVAPPPKPVEVVKVDIDAPAVATNLDSVSGPVKNQHVETETAAADSVPPPPAPTGIEAWKYLGGIFSSTYKRAIVVVNDQQHLLAEGQKFKPDPVHNPNAEVDILEIDREFVRVKENDTEHTIHISPRQKAALNVVDPAAVRAAGGPSGAAYSNPGIRGAAVSGGQLNPNPASRVRDLERMRIDAKNRGDAKAAESLEGEINAAAKDAARFEKGDKGQK